MNRQFGSIFFISFSLLTATAGASTYTLPGANEMLIGNTQYSSVNNDDTFVTIAQRYDVGYNAIVNANPEINSTDSLPNKTSLKIPTSHLLPSLPRKGIIVNLPEMRMYYYPPDNKSVVLTYPIGIGKIGKNIPITNTSVAKKVVNPLWTPPQDIREFNQNKGIKLPIVMPPGPDNPLGPYAIYMELPTYLIHSTIFPESIGKRASFGCIRMYESDIRQFFPSVQPGIPVIIINEPVKLAWQNNKLFIETYAPLEEINNDYTASLPGIIHQVQSVSENKKQIAFIDWQTIAYLAKNRDGEPHEVGVMIREN